MCDHALIRNPTPPTGCQLQLNLMQTFLYSHAATESAMQSDCANNYREETHLRHSSQCYQRLVELYRDHPGHILSFIMSHPNRPIQDSEEEFEAGVISPILWMASKIYCSQAESIISCLASHYTAVGLLAISIASQCPEQTLNECPGHVWLEKNYDSSDSLLALPMTAGSGPPIGDQIGMVRQWGAAGAPPPETSRLGEALPLPVSIHSTVLQYLVQVPSLREYNLQSRSIDQSNLG